MKTIKIRLKKDRENGFYYADVVTDVSLDTIKYSFDSLTRHDGSIIEQKVSHTRSYIIRKKFKRSVKKIGCFFKAISNGFKAGYSGYVNSSKILEESET